MNFRVPFLACLLAGLVSDRVDAQTVYPRGTTIWEQGETWDGFTLFVGDGAIRMIAMDGTEVNTWVSPIAGHVLANVDPLENGHVLAFSQDPSTGRARTVVELDFFGNLVWSYTMAPPVSPTAVMHHDLERLPNGNTLLLCRDQFSAPVISPLTVADDFILEIDPAGQIAWSWSTWQHYGEFGFDSEAMQLISDQGGDWAHTNAISSIPPNAHTDPALREGNIIVSQRYTNCVFIIDRDTDAVVWQLGPEQDQLTYGQHDAHMIEQGLPGAGNILIFDNGSGQGYPLNGRAPGFSSVPEIDPVAKQDVWRYTATDSGQLRFRFNSNIVSGAQRLPNGNTMICSGVKGRFFEVKPDGQIVWEYMSPYQAPGRGELVYRAYRLPPDWLVARASAQKPVDRFRL